jgi:hypothetical protein
VPQPQVRQLIGPGGGCPNNSPPSNLDVRRPAHAAGARLSPGQFAQPIQVVTRRWTQGVNKGIYHTTGQERLPSPSAFESTLTRPTQTRPTQTNRT